MLLPGREAHDSLLSQIGSRGVDVGFDRNYHDAVMASTLLLSESHLATSPSVRLTSDLAVLRLPSSQPHDSLFRQLGGSHRELLNMTEDDKFAQHAEVIDRLLQDDESRLLHRSPGTTPDAGGGYDDDLDLLLGEQAKLCIDAETGKIEGLL